MTHKVDTETLSELLNGLRREEASQDALLAARRAAADVLGEGRAPSDVMTLNEVADYLRLTRDELDEVTDELPAFELAGRIRVRRDALTAWVEQRERAFRQGAEASWAGEYKALHVRKGVA